MEIPSQPTNPKAPEASNSFILAMPQKYGVAQNKHYMEKCLQKPANTPRCHILKPKTISFTLFAFPVLPSKPTHFVPHSATSSSTVSTSSSDEVSEEDEEEEEEESSDKEKVGGVARAKEKTPRALLCWKFFFQGEPYVVSWEVRFCQSFRSLEMTKIMWSNVIVPSAKWEIYANILHSTGAKRMENQHKTCWNHLKTPRIPPSAQLNPSHVFHASWKWRGMAWPVERECLLKSSLHWKSFLHWEHLKSHFLCDTFSSDRLRSLRLTDLLKVVNISFHSFQRRYQSRKGLSLCIGWNHGKASKAK